MTKNKQTPENKTYLNEVPKHIAIIMDGNRRWAKNRNKPTLAGHNQGGDNVEKTIEAAALAGIKYLTLYAFSTENWNRSKAEVDGLMKLFSTFLDKRLNKLLKQEICFKYIGDIEKFPKKIQEKLKFAVEESKNFDKFTFILAINYGSRAEICNATKKIAQQYKEGKIELDQISEDTLTQNLYTHDLPEVDFLIRTGGLHRISNFLLWQSAYAELYFTPTLWPDFDKENLEKAIDYFRTVERKFGK